LNFSNVKFSVLSIFEEMNKIKRHFEFEGHSKIEQTKWLHTRKKSAIPPADVDFAGCKNTGSEEFVSYRCKTHKPSSKYAKFYAKKFVKHLSKCKFYKKYGNTADSTENKVESSVFQSRNFHIKDHSHHFTFHGYEVLYAKKVDLWDKIKELKFSQFFPCVFTSSPLTLFSAWWWRRSFFETLRNNWIKERLTPDKKSICNGLNQAQEPNIIKLRIFKKWF
jgi:hypothetical protein